MSSSFVEQLIYSIVNFMPYSFLLLLPFKSSLRYSFKKTIIIYLIFSSFEITIFMLNNLLNTNYGIYVSHYFSIILTLERFGFAALVLKTQPGKILFILLVIKNFADTCSVLSMCLFNELFNASVETQYSIYHSLCLIILLVISYYPMEYFISHNFAKNIRDAINVKMWSYLWLIPFTFYMIWYFIFYCNTITPYEMAIRPINSLFMILLFIGELMVYSVSSHLIRQSINVMTLENEVTQLKAFQKYYKTLQEHIEEVRILKHDMRHKLRSMYSLAQQGQYDQLKEALSVEIDTLPSSKIQYCENMALNLLLVYYAEKCQKSAIQFDFKVSIPKEMPISDSDITVLFGNLLENAYDAANEVKENNRFLTFKAGLYQNRLIFMLENTYENAINKDKNGKILSTKHEGYGLGISSCKMIIHRYQGTITYTGENNLYKVSIFIPYNSK